MKEDATWHVILGNPAAACKNPSSLAKDWTWARVAKAQDPNHY